MTGVGLLLGGGSSLINVLLYSLLSAMSLLNLISLLENETLESVEQACTCRIHWMDLET